MWHDQGRVLIEPVLGMLLYPRNIMIPSNDSLQHNIALNNGWKAFEIIAALNHKMHLMNKH